jgi:hypothetical protein
MATPTSKDISGVFPLTFLNPDKKYSVAKFQKDVSDTTLKSSTVCKTLFI